MDSIAVECSDVTMLDVPDSLDRWEGYGSWEVPDAWLLIVVLDVGRLNPAVRECVCVCVECVCVCGCVCVGVCVWVCVCGCVCNVQCTCT